MRNHIPSSLPRPATARLGLVALMVLVAAALLTGCDDSSSSGANIQAPPPKYLSMGRKTNVPPYMAGTIWETTEVDNIGYVPVTSFGLVVNLRNTGDSFAPTAVRDWMIKEMARHDFGSSRQPGYEHMTPERILQDPRVSIVSVICYMPPGARKGQHCDAVLDCIPGNNTTSLVNGFLYRANLRIDGANPSNPGGSVNDYAKAQGGVVVNPAYSLNASASATTQNSVRASLRRGTIPDGAVVTRDRPIHLRLREPGWALSHSIEQRISQHFQDSTVADAQDEGLIHLIVPLSYHGNWQHFVGVANHLFLDSTPDVEAMHARKLAEAATQPGAPLQDICYCWEGIGPAALPYITPLFSSRSPDVAFAAAQAAAFIGDQAGEDRLMQIARESGNSFQLAAVRDLGELPSSIAVNNMLAELLDSDQKSVRLEAFNVLVANADPHVISRPIHEDFWLDIVPTTGPPMVYASRVGTPRIAIFGPKLSLTLPVMFTAFDDRLSISSSLDHPRNVTIFYRGPNVRHPEPVVCSPELVDLIIRLSGSGQDRALQLGYGEIVAVLQGLSDAQDFPGTFALQMVPAAQRRIEAAPLIPDHGRPQAPGRPQVGDATAPHTPDQ